MRMRKDGQPAPVAKRPRGVTSKLARPLEKLVVPRVGMQEGDVAKVTEARGVYRIFCFPMQRAYVGSAKNIRTRWKLHRAQLLQGLHPNRRLQLAYNYYGPKALFLEVLEFVPGPDLVMLWTREQAWMDDHGPDLLFNVRPAGDDRFISWRNRRLRDLLPSNKRVPNRKKFR